MNRFVPRARGLGGAKTTEYTPSDALPYRHKRDSNVRCDLTQGRIGKILLFLPALRTSCPRPDLLREAGSSWRSHSPRLWLSPWVAETQNQSCRRDKTRCARPGVLRRDLRKMTASPRRQAPIDRLEWQAW